MPKQKFKTAESVLASTKGAVFIFAFFKNAIDCIMTEIPPNPHINAVIGRENKPILQFAIACAPLVHSNNPKTIPSEIEVLLKIPFKRLIIGVKILRVTKISVRT